MNSNGAENFHCFCAPCAVQVHLVWLAASVHNSFNLPKKKKKNAGTHFSLWVDVRFVRSTRVPLSLLDVSHAVRICAAAWCAIAVRTAAGLRSSHKTSAGSPQSITRVWEQRWATSLVTTGSTRILPRSELQKHESGCVQQEIVCQPIFFVDSDVEKGAQCGV